MAEKEGFEPSRPFRSLHDFQSCALDQLGDFSIAVPVLSRRCSCPPPQRDSVIIIAEDFEKSSPVFHFFQKGGGPPPSARASAHFGNDVVHGVVHGDTQLVDTSAHLCFHGISAAGHHHPHRGTGHQSGAHTDPKSGTRLHIPSLLLARS